MARKLVFLLLLVILSLPTVVGVAQLPVDVPREEVFVVDVILTAPAPGNHNFWITGPHPVVTHALMMETLWIRDQETGERVMDAAISDPMYNDDFTQMSVELRDNIYWSDGVQFTADDLVFTVETLKANPDLNAYGWSANLNRSMESVEKTGDFSVTFHLTEPTPCFHSNFEARWSGIYMNAQTCLREGRRSAGLHLCGWSLPGRLPPNGGGPHTGPGNCLAGATIGNARQPVSSPATRDRSTFWRSTMATRAEK